MNLLNVLNANSRRLLWASCVLFTIVVAAQPPVGYISQKSFEFTTNMTFPFRASLKEIFTNAKLMKRKVALSQECTNNTELAFGKCHKNYYVSEPKANHSIIFDRRAVDIVLQLLDMPCNGEEDIDQSLQFRAFPAVNDSFTSCKFVIFVVHGMIDRTRFRVFQVPGSRLRLYEETIPTVHKQALVSRNNIWTILAIMLFVATFTISLCSFRCLVSDGLDDDVELGRQIEEYARHGVRAFPSGDHKEATISEENADAVEEIEIDSDTDSEDSSDESDEASIGSAKTVATTADDEKTITAKKPTDIEMTTTEKEDLEQYELKYVVADKHL